MEFGWIAAGLACIGIGIGVGLYSRKRERELQAVWKSFASAHGLRWSESKTFWSGRRYEVQGDVRGVSVSLHKHVVHRGKSTIVYTRVVGQLPRRVVHRVQLGRRSFATKLAEWVGHPPIETGDASFDERFVLRSGSRHEAIELIGPAARADIRAFPKPLSIDCEGEVVKVSWREAERDPFVLDAAVELCATVCGARVSAAACPAIR